MCFASVLRCDGWDIKDDGKDQQQQNFFASYNLTTIYMEHTDLSSRTEYTVYIAHS